MRKVVKDKKGNIYVNMHILREVRGIGNKTLKKL